MYRVVWDLGIFTYRFHLLKIFIFSFFVIFCISNFFIMDWAELFVISGNHFSTLALSYKLGKLFVHSFHQLWIKLQTTLNNFLSSTILNSIYPRSALKIFQSVKQSVWKFILIHAGTFAQKTRLKIFMICLVENNLFVGIRTWTTI